jgi:hypothetical protein
MKLIKFLMLCFAGAFMISSNATGQANAAINILSGNSGNVNLGGVGQINVQINNTGPTSNIGVYKIRCQITVPTAIASINSVQANLPAGWTILSQSAGAINLSNGTDVITPGTARSFNISINGDVLGGPLTCGSQLTFSNGVAPGSGPGTLAGNNTSDDASQTTITVIPAPACSIAVSASVGAIACNGGTATLTATASNANGAVEYSLNGGAFQTGNTFTVNAAGSPYTVTAREASNTSCSANSSAVTVNQPSAISFSGSVTSSILSAGGTGSITVAATGGTGAKTYVITSGTTINTTGATSGVFTGLLAGSYSFTTTDANSCTATTSVTLADGAACAISVSASAGTITCNGGTTTLTAIQSGGVGSIQYSLNGGAFQSSNTFTVGAGSYTVTAREASRTSCSATSSSVSVTQPTAINASALAGSIACNGGTTTLSVTASGGTGALQYSLNGGAYQGGNSFTVGAGSYVVTVRDANLCTVNTSSVSVTQPAVVPAPVITPTNNGNGTFTLTASGFTGSLLWSTGATTASILVSASATYTVTQTIGSCSSVPTSQVVTIGSAIADPAVGQMFFTNLSDATQSANGLLFTQNYRLKLPVYNLNQFTAIPSSAINFRVNLGTKLRLDPAYNLATAPLSQYFTFSASIVADSQIVTGVQIAQIPEDFAGIAVFEVKGSLSCTSNISSAIAITNASATISDEDLNNNRATLQYTLPVTVSGTPVNVTCFGAANGNITVVASAGTTVVIRNSSNTIVTAPLAPGTYTVTATGTSDTPLSSCSNSTSVTITQPALLTLSVIGTTPSICNGGNTGTITVSGIGGTAPYSYVITVGATVNTTGATTGVFTGLIAGSYTITVTDGNGCTAIANATVAQPTGTATDLSLGSDISGSLYATNGVAQTIVYNISEIAGNPAVGDTLRITKVAGFDITFNNALTSVLIAPTTYSLDNPGWKIDNSNPAFVSIIKKASAGAGPGTINCGETLKIAITLTRNTTNISTFPLSARIRKANGELNLSNNFNSIIFTAE